MNKRLFALKRYIFKSPPSIHSMFERRTQAQNQLILHLLYQWRCDAMLYWSLSCNHLHRTLCSLRFLSLSVAPASSLCFSPLQSSRTINIAHAIQSMLYNWRAMDGLLICSLYLIRCCGNQIGVSFNSNSPLYGLIDFGWKSLDWSRKKKVDNHCSIENRSQSTWINTQCKQ